MRYSDPVDENAVQQLKEFDGTKLKPTTKEGLDFGDQDEKKTLAELKIEPEPLRKLMKEALGDKVEEAIVNDRIVDSLCVPTMSEHSLSADMERIMKAQAPRDNSMHFASGSKQQLQAAQQEREEGRKEKSEKVEGGEWETVVGRRRKEEKRERKRDRREKVGTQEGEEKGDARVDKVVMDAEIQIFVKADGAKTVAMEVSLGAKVRNVARRVLRSGSEDDQDMYVVSDGRVLKGNEELGSCGVRDGITVQVVRRLRGGGRSKGKVPSGGKKNSPKKVEQNDQSMKEKSLPEVDVVVEMFDRCSRTRVGGLSAEMMEAMLGMDDEQTDKMLRMIRSNFTEEVGGDPENGDWRNQEVRAGAKAEKRGSARGRDRKSEGEAREGGENWQRQRRTCARRRRKVPREWSQWKGQRKRSRRQG